MTVSTIDNQYINPLHNAECCYGELSILFIVMLRVIILNVIMLNAVMLSVVAPLIEPN
jgi:hypothetical protein